ncbi:MAG TPA: peptide chain release factor 3, partial [Leptospiraceae bacterium]|nr:peptide chain release factor 3 [Leptospiraceae bacterium]
LIPTDTSKLKQFKKGIQELAEEGVVQIFSTQDGSVVIGAAGQLQFEVFRFRMEDEYGAPCRLEVMPFECSRWIRPSDANKFSSYDRIVKDEKGRTVVLFKSEYRLKSFLQTNADIPVYDHPPQAD